MNLETLFNKILESGRIKPSRLAHLRMSIKNYVQALGCPSASNCPKEVFMLDKETRNQIIEEHLSEKKSPHLLRNTKNDISFLFRQAEELNLIKIPDQETGKIQSYSKYKLGRSLPKKVSPKKVGFHRDSYGLKLRNWNENLKKQYDDWKEWVSEERELPKEINPYNRPGTIEDKTNKLEAYFGYLSNIRSIRNIDFRMLLDVSSVGLATLDDNSDFVKLRKNSQVGLLEEFIEWLYVRNQNKDTFQASGILGVAASTVQKYYLMKAVLDKNSPDIDKYGAIATEINVLQKHIRNRLEISKSTTEKDQLHINAETLRQVARKEFPSAPLFSYQSGTVTAVNAGRALAIMLLTNYPLRNVNYREAQLSQNIIKGTDGRWVLRFSGEDEIAGLKSKRRLNQVNFYEKVIDSETAHLIDKYLSEWRPKLIQQIDNEIQSLKNENQVSPKNIESLEKQKDFFFLNSKGKPFTRPNFSTWIEKGIYRQLGVRISPEKIRQIANSEMPRQEEEY